MTTIHTLKEMSKAEHDLLSMSGTAMCTTDCIVNTILYNSKVVAVMIIESMTTGEVGFIETDELIKRVKQSKKEFKAIYHDGELVSPGYSDETYASVMDLLIAQHQPEGLPSDAWTEVE